jgi:hypothetical protein
VASFLLIINKRRWDHVEVPWLPAGELQADPLGDLRTSGNALSVWHIDDARTNLTSVVTALVANRKEVDFFEYGLFDEFIPRNLGIHVASSEGSTPLASANHWHCDLIHLSSENLLALAKALFEPLDRNRLLREDVENLLVAAIHDGRLHAEALKPRVKDRIERLL